MQTKKYLKCSSILFCILVLNSFISCSEICIDISVDLTVIVENKTNSEFLIVMSGVNSISPFHGVVDALKVIETRDSGASIMMQKEIGTPTISFYQKHTPKPVDNYLYEYDASLEIKTIDDACYLFELLAKYIYKTEYEGWYGGRVEYKLVITDELLGL